MRVRICHIVSCTSGFLAAIFGIASARWVYITGVDSDDYIYSGDIATCAVLGVTFLLDCSLQGLLIAKRQISTVLRTVVLICNVAALATIVAVGAVTAKSHWISTSPYLIPVAIAFGAISVVFSVLGAFIHRESRHDSIEESPSVPEVKSMQWPVQQQMPSMAYHPQQYASAAASPAQTYAPSNSVPVASQVFPTASQLVPTQTISPPILAPAPKQALSARPRSNNPLLVNTAAYSPA